MTKLLRVYRVAELLDCSKSQVYAMIQRQELCAVRLGERGIRITLKSLDNYLNDKKVDPDD
jgi:excisionase family DNA binding protein